MSSELDINQINLIVKKTINGISSSMKQVLEIVDNVRHEQESLMQQLEKLRKDISDIIDEVDMLEKQDKIMRRKLAEVSGDFKRYTEDDIKTVYEQAAEVRIQYITKKNEEMALRQRRDAIEISFKKTIQNIESGEKVVSQISIALNYLEGDIMSMIDGQDKNTEMFMGIKILEAQENERKRIARDIHDGPAQYMANAIMKADLCSRLLNKNFDDGLKELADLKESMKTALKEVRGIIFDLRPMSLDDLGLNQTIRETVNSIIDESGIDIQIRLRPMKEDAEVEPIIQVALYRIIQEIFNNIKKHSQAKHVELSLDYGTKYLGLMITDDGVGFDVEETLLHVKTKGTSYGLLGIYDRVSQLQGEIKIKSEKGAGTIYNLRLPINREVIKDEQQGN